MTPLALYIRALDIPKHTSDFDPFLERLYQITEPIGISKIYLEIHRDQIVVEETVMSALKTILEENGYTTAAGLTLTIDEMNAFQTYCYSNEEHRAQIKDLVRYSVTLFDALLFDDFFFTNCKCRNCIREKGQRSWTEYRLEQMTEASRNLVLGPAKAENSKAKIIIKYPNWYEHFPQSGFNLKDQPPLYDGIYTGNETRDPRMNNQHLQPYQSFGIQQYYEAIKPGGNLGGWIDPAGGEHERYERQIWLTLMAGARELTFFAYHAMNETWCKKAESAIKSFRAIEPYISKVRGVVSYKPYHSHGEDFLHQYFGMLGVPVMMTPLWPKDEPVIFLNEASSFDEEIYTKVLDYLHSGGKLVVTTGFIRALSDRGLDEIAHLKLGPEKILVDRGMIGWKPEPYFMQQPVLMTKLHTMTNEVWESVAGIAGWSGTPLLTKIGYGDGEMTIVSIPDNPSDLYEYPKEILMEIRGAMLKDTPGIPILDGPAKIILLSYDDHVHVLMSYREETVTVNLLVKELEGQLVDPMTGQVYPILDGRVAIKIDPKGFRVLAYKAQ